MVLLTKVNSPITRFILAVPLTFALLSCSAAESGEAGTRTPTTEKTAMPLKESLGAKPTLVYIGTYTQGESEGIYLFEMDPATGALTPKGVTKDVTNPSFLTLHPGGEFLYAVNEIGNFEGAKTGSVSAFAIDPETGALKFLNRKASGGAAPCHLVVDRTGKNVLVANYSGGSVCVLRLEENGHLGPRTALVKHVGSSAHPKRQTGPHAHGFVLDAPNRIAFVADLGIDKVVAYAFDPSKGTLEARDDLSASLQPGAGPRHLCFHPNGQHAYVINELDSTVTAFKYDVDRGSLEKLQTLSTLPRGFEGKSSTAEIAVHPSGKFLYGSNRGHDSIAVFSIDPERGTLSPVERESTRGKTPRNFSIHPSGRFLLAANQGTDTVVVFLIDQATGGLEYAGCTVKVAAPVCITFFGGSE